MKILLTLICFSACTTAGTVQPGFVSSDEVLPAYKTDRAGTTVQQRILLPEGYSRKVRSADTAYTEYLRNLPLKLQTSAVHLYNGSLKNRQDVHAAVLDIPVGSLDLQQCADAVMRIRADYLYHSGQYELLSFNFTNGFPAAYKKWRSGQSIRVQGNACQWVASSSSHTTEESYRQYLQTVFSYAGSLSLSRQLKPVDDIRDIQAGDVWIRGGSPGHTVFVVDVAQDSKGEKIFLLAQSYMPAQDIHILKNPGDTALSPWYRITDIDTELETPEYVFNRNELMRF